MATLKQAIRTNLEAYLPFLYTHLPAKVVTYDPDTQTATMQPLVNFTWDDGVVHEESVITDVPVIFPSAGGGIISFKVDRGDTMLLCFSMRSIDEWVEGEGEAITPSEDRQHELNDAIAIPGLYPKKRVLDTNPDDVEIKYKGNKVTLKESGDIVIEGGTINLGEGATESVVLGDSLKAWLESHTHQYTWYGGVGVTAPPATPFTGLSKKVKTE